jgi:hypothetical protein
LHLVRLRAPGAGTDRHGAAEAMPTPCSTLRSGLRVLVRCTACRHRSYADQQKLIDTGRGDVPLIRLKYRCTNCAGGAVHRLGGDQRLHAVTTPRLHRQSYGTEPMPTLAEALSKPLRAFPSWFLKITCDRCGKE